MTVVRSVVYLVDNLAGSKADSKVVLKGATTVVLLADLRAASSVLKTVEMMVG